MTPACTERPNEYEGEYNPSVTMSKPGPGPKTNA